MKQGGQNERLRLLIVVDDSDSAAIALEIALEGLGGVEFVRFRRAEPALKRIQQDSSGNCCALVTDLSMPGMDGFELMRQVRRIRASKGFPIIVVSGDDDSDTLARVQQLGASAFFSKPFSPVEVRRTLETLLDENEKPNFAV